jgi:benzoyl-CoA 2,3-dioxygenase component B
MPSSAAWDQWVADFGEWQRGIGFDSELIQDYAFEAKYAGPDQPRIEFGDYRGERKWERVRDIPDQRIRDALLHLIVYQGDTEFASVEQQRHLVASAPTEYDRKSALRVMAEEMRHGWQMCHVMVTHFGRTGEIEAKKQLRRRSVGMTGPRAAGAGSRLLGSFNQPCDNWLDFFVFTMFIDRDGKFQLKMLEKCAFLPLGSSIGPMLKEEAFHLGTGNNGLHRIIKAGKIPIDVLQRRFNKWIPTAYDLFGTDNSSTAEWAYVWGLKSRPDEEESKQDADRKTLNDHARRCYHEEVKELIERMNERLPRDSAKLKAPDLRFNRKIGAHAGGRYDVDGNPVDPSKYDSYIASALPTPEDGALLAKVFARGDWIAPTRF